MKNGGSPGSFLLRAQRDLKLSDTDRSSYELEVLLTTFEMAGAYDQVNLANLSCFELLARRVQLILDAHSGG